MYSAVCLLFGLARAWEPSIKDVGRFFSDILKPPFPILILFYFYPSGNLKAILTPPPPSKLSTSFMDGPLHHKRSKRALGWQNHEYQNPLVVNLEKKWLVLGGDLGGSNFFFSSQSFLSFFIQPGGNKLKTKFHQTWWYIFTIHYSIVNYTVIFIHFLLFLIQFTMKYYLSCCFFNINSKD